MSSTNYDCVGLPGNKCSESLRLYNLLKGQFPKAPQEKCKNECLYKSAKNEFIQGQLGVTNYAYFLAETVYSGKLEPRELLVIDECHNLPSTLSKFIEIKVTENFCETLGVKFIIDTTLLYFKYDLIFLFKFKAIIDLILIRILKLKSLHPSF